MKRFIKLEQTYVNIDNIQTIEEYGDEIKITFNNGWCDYYDGNTEEIIKMIESL